MTLVQLHYFRAVCAHKNITRAARELHISQPSLSKAIRDLEGELGLSLFYRLHTGLVLTEEGAQLLEAAEALLREEDAFLTGFLLERFRALGIEPQVLLHTNQLATIAQLVGRGVAASFLFDHVLPPEREIAKLPVAGLPRIRIYLIWNARRPLSPGTKNLIRLARLLYPAPPREEAEEGRP